MYPICWPDTSITNLGVGQSTNSGSCFFASACFDSFPLIVSDGSGVAPGLLLSVACDDDAGVSFAESSGARFSAGKSSVAFVEGAVVVLDPGGVGEAGGVAGGGG